MTLGTDPVVLDTTGETSPYPYFEYMRRTDPVWHGTFMDQSQLPEELRPHDEWVLFGYDGVFQGFRDDRTFTSAEYDKTIGLVMGHTILAMGGKEHHDHRSLVGQGLSRHGTTTVGALGHRTGLQCADRRNQIPGSRRLGECADVRISYPDHLRAPWSSP